MSLFGQGWWLDLLMAGLSGVLLGGVVQALRSRQQQLAQIDAIHRRCWAEQDRWLDEHEARMADAVDEQAGAQARELALVQARDEALSSLSQSQSAVERLEAEVAHLRSEAEGTGQALHSLTVARDDSLKAAEQLRREMDGARVGYSKAEQALCQQLMALDRQVAAERTAHRREVQALRIQCDELNDLLAAVRLELAAAQTRSLDELSTPWVEAAEHQQVCQARDELRDEVVKLLDLLDQSDTAQAALQHRANVLEQQIVIGQRQLEDLRQSLERERARPSLMRPVAQAAITTIATAALEANSSRSASSSAGGREPRPFERLTDSPVPDNLQRIKGVGPANQAWLNRCGVWYLWQIAGWKAEEQQWVAAHLPRFGRRLYREGWVAQAKALLDEQRRERRVYPARLPPGVPDRRVNAAQPRVMAAA